MKSLAIYLSKLKGFEKPNAELEQYMTESQIAHEILQYAFTRGEIRGKTIVDLGCGTGIFGIGCLILGAKKVYFIDIDKKALDLTKQNISLMENELNADLNAKAVLISSDIENISIQKYKGIDIAIENPPFGTKNKRIDSTLLHKSMGIASIVYSFHKFETSQYIEEFIRKENFVATNVWRFKFLLRNTMSFHKKQKQYIDVGCWRAEKKVA